MVPWLHVLVICPPRILCPCVWAGPYDWLLTSMIQQKWWDVTKLLTSELRLQKDWSSLLSLSCSPLEASPQGKQVDMLLTALWRGPHNRELLTWPSTIKNLRPVNSRMNELRTRSPQTDHPNGGSLSQHLCCQWNVLGVEWSGAAAPYVSAGWGVGLVPVGLSKKSKSMGRGHLIRRGS